MDAGFPADAAGAMMIECHIDDQETLRFIPIPKNAGTSIISAMFDLHGTVEEIHANKPRRGPWTEAGYRTFAVVRSPWHRFISTWANKVHRPHRPDTALIREHGVPLGASLEAFLDIVEERGAMGLDGHVRPQVSFLPPSGVTLLRFEHLDYDWCEDGFERVYGPLGRYNCSTRPRGKEMLATQYRVENLYAEDVALWEKVCAARARDLPL